MAKVKTLRDKDDNIIYPQTSATVVHTADGNSVNDIILKGVSVAPVASVLQTPEVTENKVTTISSTSNNTQYPSAKATYDFVLANKSEGLKIEVVQVLPTTDIDTKTLYLVPKDKSETGDIYDEYIYVNNQWEHIGSTEVDLSQYAKKTELPTKTSDLNNDSGFIDTTTANSTYMTKTAPTGTGSLSINRKANTTVGIYSTATGINTTASGANSHAEGNNTIASGESAHVEGRENEASGRYGSHAEGYSTTAIGESAHAEGQMTVASGAYSHAEGAFCTANEYGSHVEGSGTIASSSYQHVQGICNVADSQGTYADIIGSGTSTVRKNIEATTWTGDKRLKGDVYVHCNDDSTGGNKLATETYVDAHSGGAWGSITGDISDQTDLGNAFADIKSDYSRVDRYKVPDSISAIPVEIGTGIQGNLLIYNYNINEYADNMRVLIDIPDDSQFDDTVPTYININNLGNKIINHQLQKGNQYELIYMEEKFNVRESEVPIGEIRIFSTGDRTDSEYLLLDGSLINRSDYPDVINKISGDRNYIYYANLIDSDISTWTYSSSIDIAFGGGYYIAMARGTSSSSSYYKQNIYYSQDGYTWNKAFSENIDYAGTPFATYIPEIGRYFAGGKKLYSSTDGINWVTVLSGRFARILY